MEDGPIDHIPRPLVLQGVTKAYGILVVGTSMSPMYRPGMTLHVNPHRAPRAGRGVIVWKHSRAVLIKEFVRRTDRELILREYQPELREIRIPMAEIAAIHTVVGLDDD